MTDLRRDLARLEQQIKASSSKASRHAAAPLVVPDIEEFVWSDRYLGLRAPKETVVYPRQLCLLKVAFLQSEVFSAYDERVIEEWVERFERGDENGIQPDILERIARNKQEGRHWFREVLAVLGRRGSKNFLGAIAGAYVLYNHIARGNPQHYYGLDPDETLTAMVIASKHDQALSNQWRDLRDRVLGARCFRPYIAKPLAETLRIYSPHDLERLEEDSDFDWRRATFEITAVESSPSAVRGLACFSLHFDEMAFGQEPGTLASADELYEAAVPSLDQLRGDGFIWESSTPWYQRGQFFENYQRGLARNENGPGDHRVLVVQLESWDLYRDWQHAHDIERAPGREQFPRFAGPVISYDEELQGEERRNPDRFAVERRAHFAVSGSAYLPSAKCHAMFGGRNGEPLTMQTQGKSGVTYVVHVDPSRVGDHTAVAVAHREDDTDGLAHYVFDIIESWDPADFDNHEIPTTLVRERLEQIIARFQPARMSFDQPEPLETMQGLRDYVRRMGYRTQIDRKANTRAENWQIAETFKSHLIEERVHAPFHQRALDELLNLEDRGGRVDHPNSGPVTSKDCADTIFECVFWLADPSNNVFAALAETSVRGMYAGGFPVGAAGGEVQAQLSESMHYSANRRPRGYDPARGDRFRDPRGRY
jgi:hypothetical protein